MGLALINTSLNNRMDLHLARLHDKVSWSNTAALEALANLTQKLSTLGSDAELMALKQLTRQVRQQGMVMAIGDVFFGIALLFASLVILLPLMKRPIPVPISRDAH